MTIKPSTALRNEYPKIASLAKETGEPIFITNKGEADGVYMSIGWLGGLRIRWRKSGPS